MQHLDYHQLFTRKCVMCIAVCKNVIITSPVLSGCWSSITKLNELIEEEVALEEVALEEVTLAEVAVEKAT